MQTDDYIIDANGSWSSPQEALEWYRAQLATERANSTCVWQQDGEEWSATKDFAPLAQRIEPWSPKMAQAQFIARFLDLTAGNEWLG
jgi:hypothetical protein